MWKKTVDISTIYMVHIPSSPQQTQSLHTREMLPQTLHNLHILSTTSQQYLRISEHSHKSIIIAKDATH